MTHKEALLHIFYILNRYWIHTSDKKPIDDLGLFLGEFDIISDDENPTADPAAWDDWENTIRKVTKVENVTEEDALKAMILLLKEYNDNQGFNLKIVIEHFEKERPIV
jgi:hypothetical protein